MITTNQNNHLKVIYGLGAVIVIMIVGFIFFVTSYNVNAQEEKSKTVNYEAMTIPELRAEQGSLDVKLSEAKIDEQSKKTAWDNAVIETNRIRGEREKIDAVIVNKINEPLGEGLI